MNHRGFSLAETVIAVLILSTLSVVLVGVVPATVTGTRSAGRRATASVIAAQTLENARSALSAYGDDYQAQVVLSGIPYDVTVRSDDVRDAANVAVDASVARTLTVTVTWPDRPNVTGTYACTTTVFKQ